MSGSRESDLLARLGRLCGILDGYYDVWRNFHVTAPETRRRLLRAMGLRVDTAEELKQELDLREAAGRELLCAPVVVLGEGAPQLLRLRPPPGFSEVIRLGLHEGEIPLRVTAGGAEGAVAQIDPPLPPGLHDAEVRLRGPGGAASCRTTLAVCPDRAHAPEAVERGGRLWGVNVPLYGVRSGRNWGVGDFEDLRTAVVWAAELGADLVGLLPLHALFDELPYGVSPYYPSSRLFLNPVYVAVDRVPEAESPEVRAFLEREATRLEIERLRETPLVDYPGVWALKREALGLCHDAFRGEAVPPARRAAFAAWRRAQGHALADFAAFTALREHLARRDGCPSGWQRWPEELQRPDSEAVRAFRESHAGEIELCEYVQWVASEQLGAAAGLARARGMAVGLYLDLALGVDPSGADAWMYKDLLALTTSAGCPPDPFSLLGQRWGLPPTIPERHRSAGYSLFLETLRRNAAFAGALRIDHALALWRLFWIPEGLPASGGAYVAERPEELLALLRLVSRENRCLVVGEDLGTIPAEVRQGLMDSGCFSYRLALFERGPDGRHRKPADYPRQALVSVSTHDLPTLDGFWLGTDLEVKRELGRYPDEESARADEAARRRDRSSLLRAVEAEGLLPQGAPTESVPAAEQLDDLAVSVHGFLARAASALFLVNLDDLLAEKQMQNLPGTVQEHPNWRRKTPIPLEQWGESSRVDRIAAAVRRERPSPSATTGS